MDGSSYCCISGRTPLVVCLLTHPETLCVPDIEASVSTANKVDEVVFGVASFDPSTRLGIDPERGRRVDSAQDAIRLARQVIHQSSLCPAMSERYPRVEWRRGWDSNPRSP